MTDIDDPFPRDQATDLVKRLPGYARLALAVSRDPSLPGSQRMALIGAGAYVVSPIGLVPGFIPLLGQLDDLWVLLTALRFGLDALPPQEREAHLMSAGLAGSDLDDDLAAAGHLVAWSARRGRNAAQWMAASGRRVGRQLAETVSRVGTDIARRVEDQQTDRTE